MIVAHLTPTPYFLIAFAAWNLIVFLTYGIDKLKAKKEKWRIPEKTLFFLSIIGGSLGSVAGMYLFHHKTRHWYFVIGMPLILVAHIVLAILVYYVTHR